jgi:hypothetical protein
MIRPDNIIFTFVIFTLLAGTIFFSCQSLNEEELFGNRDCDTSIVTYSESILPIIQNNCYECHSGTNPISFRNFEGYNNFEFYVSSGKVYGAVNHLSGFANMPKDRNKLPDCELGKINKWIREGALNN